MFSIKRVLGSSRYVLFFIVFIVLISNNLKISTFFYAFSFYINLKNRTFCSVLLYWFFCCIFFFFVKKRSVYGFYLIDISTCTFYRLQFRSGLQNDCTAFSATIFFVCKNFLFVQCQP